MKETHYIMTTIKEGNRLEVLIPTLAVGETVEVIVIAAERAVSPIANPLQNGGSIDRRAFMRLPMAERGKILAQQAELMLDHYEQDPEWREWVSFDNQELSS